MNQYMWAVLSASASVYQADLHSQMDIWAGDVEEERPALEQGRAGQH